MSTAVCGGNLTGPTGRLASPGYGDRPVPGMDLRQADCNWTIAADEGTVVGFRFTSFSVRQLSHSLSYLLQAA